MQLRRSQLFVPGNDERKIRKALYELPECDSIVFDLEDSVPHLEKQSARAIIRRLLSPDPSSEEAEQLDSKGRGRRKKKREMCVRINAAGSQYFRDDVDLVRTLERVTCIVVPKAEWATLSNLHGLVREKSLIPLIETARGLTNIDRVVGSEGVVAVAYGAADFANSLGGRVEVYMGSLYVKTKIAVCARAAGIEPLDNVYFRYADIEGFRREASASRDLGFAGKQLIHPGQIAVANEVYSPSEEEVRRSEEVVRAYEKESEGSGGRGALSLNMELIDAVHYRLAKDTLARKAMIDSDVSKENS